MYDVINVKLMWRYAEKTTKNMMLYNTKTLKIKNKTSVK